MPDNVAVLTPFLHGSTAIELGSRTWSKRILPIGDVEYQGRMLHFSPEYLKDLASAFNDRAYDQVPFQLATSDNAHTNDPERTAGYISELALKPDGLHVIAKVTDRGEKVLSENPQLGVSARIVEGYARSDGKFYPAAIQHVLGTLDPRIPGLGAWQAVEMSNAPAMIIDLSASQWAGEPGMTLADAVSLLAARLPARDADADMDLDAVIAASLPADYSLADSGADAYGQFTELANASLGAEQARVSQDAAPPARRSEDRLANALDRAARGTFTPQGMYAREAVYGFAAQALGTVLGTATCGPADDLGYCQERYHAAGCGSAASPDIAQGLMEQHVYEGLALAPAADSRGLTWRDRESGSEMSMTDHIEAASGVRLADADPYSPRPRRELIQAARPQVFGDPDDPDAAPGGIPQSTARTAAAMARQGGIATPADARQNRDAAIRERSRQLARLKPPRHADYAEFSNPDRHEVRPALVTESWNGSVPQYGAA